MGQSIIKNIRRVFAQNGGGGGGVAGSGTTNYIPKWTPDGFTLGNSQIFDNGTNVGVGTTSPAAKLTVVGATTLLGIPLVNARFSDDLNSSLLIASGASGVNYLVGNTQIALMTGSSGSITEKFRINEFGAAMIGLTNGTAQLTVRKTASLGAADIFELLDINGVTVLKTNESGLTGFGTTTPTARGHFKGIDATSSNFAGKFVASDDSLIAAFRNDRFVSINGLSAGNGRLEVTGGSSQGVIATSSSIALNGIASGNGSIGVVAQVQSGAGTSLYVRSYDANNILTDWINSSTNSIARMLDNGFLGLNTTNPTSRLQVVGLPTYADNAAAIAGGLTAGAMYIRTGHGLDIVV